MFELIYFSTFVLHFNGVVVLVCCCSGVSQHHTFQPRCNANANGIETRRVHYIVNVPSSAINQAESSIRPSLHWKNPTSLSPHEVWVGVAGSSGSWVVVFLPSLTASSVGAYLNNTLFVCSFIASMSRCLFS